MQHPLKRAGLILAALFLVVFATLPHAAKGAIGAGPQQMYWHAWQLVRDSFYDPTFNNQNWETWHHKYDGKLQTDDQAYAAIKEMLASLGDQYTRLLEPKAFKEEDDAINSVVVGIGISLRPYSETHALVINDVIDGGPAAKAGLQYNDKIVAIDGELTANYDTDKAADKIRGKAGTAVKLTIDRSGTKHDVTIERQQVSIPSVISKTLDHNIGYIKLTTFMSDDASAEFRWALQRFQNAPGLVIDLRDNPGGLLANALEIADMLMDRGKIVTTVSRHGRNTDTCSGMGQICQQPIVLLVDKDSASASEILAGCLKDNGRATIIGTKTYGKGLVQEINRLPSGAGIHITVARYYTPNGSDINKIGIEPDVAAADREKQLNVACDVLQQKIAARGGSPLGLIAAPPKRYSNFSDNKLVSPRS